jgi:hypothetical protein
MKKIIILFFVLFLLAQIGLEAGAKTIKAGVSESTPVEIVAEWPIGPDTSIGEHFSARVISDVVSDRGELFIPKNSRVVGIVRDIKQAGSFHRAGKVDIDFQKIIFPDNVSTITIDADGNMIKHTKRLETAAVGTGKVLVGAAKGAVTGFQFGGILATGSSDGMNIAIGAAAGAAISLVSFIAQKGQEVEIFPGLPMTLAINDMQKQDYTAQQLSLQKTDYVVADIEKFTGDSVKVKITNNLDKSIPLTNLKIVDGLGYIIKPDLAFKFFDNKVIPPNSEASYKFKFNPTTKQAKYWLVLTDSFGKQEYFREDLR